MTQAMSQKSDTQSTRWILKKATQDVHDELDQAMSELGIATYEGFAAYLMMNVTALRTIRKGMDDKNALWIEALKDLENAAQQDLQTIGAPCPEVKQILPPQNYTLGAMYVVTGSRLGAKLLKREKEKSADPRLPQANRFFDHRKVDDIWKPVLSDLETTSPSQHSDLIEDAFNAFSLFKQALPKTILP